VVWSICSALNGITILIHGESDRQD
jgi:hypothetical protein